ncbi:hypothetical protein OGATHE_003145 [Ogataea polymorpha]|uniref:Uncharacterized protein n=1 Tax=Ogataea polymorpha TaxID=460523 RepID=A0A9P8P925_9ASCO|nr:hypothetical protein OGATHE_003145 [Ogataea polymorpha]
MSWTSWSSMSVSVVFCEPVDTDLLMADSDESDAAFCFFRLFIRSIGLLEIVFMLLDRLSPSEELPQECRSFSICWNRLICDGIDSSPLASSSSLSSSLEQTLFGREIDRLLLVARDWYIIFGFSLRASSKSSENDGIMRSMDLFVMSDVPKRFLAMAWLNDTTLSVLDEMTNAPDIYGSECKFTRRMPSSRCSDVTAHGTASFSGSLRV